MQNNMRIAGARNTGSRNFNAPMIYQPTIFDEWAVKAAKFGWSLIKQLALVFGSVLLDHGAKAIRSKGDEKIQGIFDKETNIQGNYNKNQLYNNQPSNNTNYPYNSSNSYDRYDKYAMNNTAYSNNNIPGFGQ